VGSRFGKDAPSIEVEQRSDGAVVVTLHGEFDLLNAAEVEERLLREGRSSHGLVVDLSRMSFIDAATIHAIKQAYETLRDSRQRMILQVGTDTIVDRALTIAGLQDYLPCASNREDALRLATE
jgi:anti-anti-sigma factor